MIILYRDKIAFLNLKKACGNIEEKETKIMDKLLEWYYTDIKRLERKRIYDIQE